MLTLSVTAVFTLLNYMSVKVKAKIVLLYLLFFFFDTTRDTICMQYITLLLFCDPVCYVIATAKFLTVPCNAIAVAVQACAWGLPA